TKTRKFAHIKDIDEIKRSNLIRDEMRELNKHSMYDNLESNIWVYFKNHDLVLSRSRYYDSEQFYKEIINYEGITYEEWLTDIEKIGRATVWISKPIITSGEKPAQNLLTHIDTKSLNDAVFITLID